MKDKFLEKLESTIDQQHEINCKSKEAMIEMDKLASEIGYAIDWSSGTLYKKK